MSRWRRAARTDSTQSQIVQQLRAIPGVTVAPGHDDILVGYNGRTLWYEIKAPTAISRRTGKPLSGAVKPSQEKLLAEWKGHYHIVSTLEEILDDLNMSKRH